MLVDLVLLVVLYFFTIVLVLYGVAGIFMAIHPEAFAEFFRKDIYTDPSEKEIGIYRKLGKKMLLIYAMLLIGGILVLIIMLAGGIKLAV